MKHFLRYGKAVGEFEWNFPAEYPQPLLRNNTTNATVESAEESAEK